MLDAPGLQEQRLAQGTLRAIGCWAGFRVEHLCHFHGVGRHTLRKSRDAAAHHACTCVGRVHRGGASKRPGSTLRNRDGCSSVVLKEVVSAGVVDCKLYRLFGHNPDEIHL